MKGSLPALVRLAATSILFATAACVGDIPGEDNGSGITEDAGAGGGNPSGGGAAGTSPTASGGNVGGGVGTAASGGGGSHENCGVDPLAPSPACSEYCTTIMTTCTGDQQQYVDQVSCLGVCVRFSEEQLTCRKGHTDLGHCTHGGPGGDGGCGSNCEGFCTIAGAACPSAFTDTAACLTACEAFPTPDQYDVGDTAGDTLACRLYYATMAARDAAGACTYCEDVAAASPACE